MQVPCIIFSSFVSRGDRNVSSHFDGNGRVLLAPHFFFPHMLLWERIKSLEKQRLTHFRTSLHKFTTIYSTQELIYWSLSNIHSASTKTCNLCMVKKTSFKLQLFLNFGCSLERLSAVKVQRKSSSAAPAGNTAHLCTPRTTKQHKTDFETNFWENRSLWTNTR